MNLIKIRSLKMFQMVWKIYHWVLEFCKDYNILKMLGIVFVILCQAI